LPYLLDTDTFSKCLRGGAHVQERIAREEEAVYLSVVAFREAMRGALAALADAESPTPRFRVSVPEAYRFLQELSTFAMTLPLWSYTMKAEALYLSWPKNIHRIGPRDCRIATSAIVGGLTVVTSNLRHFEQIAAHELRLQFEDWSSGL
jgi:predicted nucleic acid-binding protein